MFSQLALVFEFLNYYRKEQDRQWRTSQPTVLYNRFCDLVAKHYRENRNVKSAVF